MSSKRIAIIVWSLTISGGGARQILELALALQKKGHKVDLFCVVADAKTCYPHLISQLNVYSVDAALRRKTYPLAKFSSTKKLLYLLPHFKNKKHDLLLLRDLIQQHDKVKHYDAFNYHETEVYKLSYYFDPKKNFWMMNDLFVTGESLPETWFRKYSHAEYIAKYKNRMNKVIVLDNINKAIVKKYLHTEAVVIRSGLDQKQFYHKRNYINKSKFKLLATGIFFPHRRYEDLIEAMHILVNKEHLSVFLSIIGEPKTDMTYYSLIKSLIEKYKLQKHINLLGRVPEKELITQYKTSDIFVFPNNPQTWGLAVFEAMLAGCVAVVSKGAGAHEVLKDGKNALLAPPESPEEIAKQIKKVINNQSLLKQISKDGQDFVKYNISWDKYAADMFAQFIKQ